MFSRNTSSSFYFLLVINSGIISFVTITSSDSLLVIILSDSIIILIVFKNVRNARTSFRYCKIVWLLFWKYSLENSVDMLILFWLSVNHSLTLTKSKIITYTAVDWSLKTVGVTVWTYFVFSLQKYSTVTMKAFPEPYIEKNYAAAFYCWSLV